MDDTLIELARQAGFTSEHNHLSPQIEKLARIVADKERDSLQSSQPIKKSPLKHILLDSICFASFYGWLVLGNSNAENVAVFMCWTFGVAGIVAGLIANKTHFTHTRTPAFKLYHWITSLLVILLLAWAGNFWCAGTKFVAVLLLEAARTREDNKK